MDFSKFGPFEIEKGIPMPHIVFPFDDMEVGDSFRLAEDEERGADWRGVVAAVMQSASDHPYRFKSATEEGGLRIWRVPHLNPAVDLTGRYVIVRCRDAGVHAGVLESYTGRRCSLTEARRLWYWVAAKDDFLNGVATHGLAVSRNGRESRISGPVERIHLTENCEIIATTEEAEKSIRGFAIHNG